MTATPYAVIPPQQYLRWGYNPTPLRPGTKAPRLKAWQTLDPFSIRWNGDELFGVICGEMPCGFFLIVPDLDHKPERGVIAEESYQDILRRMPPDILRKLFITRSTSGNGYHLWIAAERNVQKGILYDEQGRRIGELIGKGGQVVVQPPDRWVQGTPDTIEPLSNEELQQVLAVLRYKHEEPILPKLAVPARQDRPGDDYTARGDFGTVLKAYGWTLAYTRGDVSYWCRPGKDKREGISASLGHHPGLFYVFSTNAEPFEGGHGYSVFSAYAMLKHHGNRSAAAAELAAQGFGRQTVYDKTPSPFTVELGPDGQTAFLPPPVAAEAGGRPTKLTPDMLWFYMGKRRDGVDKVMLTSQEIADDLGVSRRTVERCEKILKDRGWIERRRVGGGSNRTYIAILVSDKTPQDKNSVSNAPTRTHARRPLGDCHHCRQGQFYAEVDGEWRCDHCDQAPMHVTVVTDGLDAYAGVRLLKDRLVLVAHYVHTNGLPHMPIEDVQRAVEIILQDRKQAKADARFTAKLRTLPDAKLRAKRAGILRRMEDFKNEGRYGEMYAFGRMAWLIEQEDERRAPLRKVIREKPKPILMADLADNRLLEVMP